MACVLITGTSKGIGLATALVFGRAGHEVYATMRDPVRCPELAEMAAKEGLPIYVSAMNVDSDASVAEGIAIIAAQAGQIDVLVNNAGIARAGALEELAMADIKAVMETNYFGAVRCMKAVAGQMRERRSGCVINVTSIAGQVSTSPLGVYAASKFALEAVSEAFAQEMKMFGVRVAIVQPGIIDTPMAHGIEDAAEDSPYPQRRRFAHLFAAALKTPTPPSLVAEKILEIAESGTWQLRHPVGPNAAATMAGRRATPDEEYIALHGADDETWYSVMEGQTGRVIRPGKTGNRD
jgi:NAD(P)-dependent dehydrogenase (short-subunit alcohol dehydrogenase family)